MVGGGFLSDILCSGDNKTSGSHFPGVSFTATWGSLHGRRAGLDCWYCVRSCVCVREVCVEVGFAQACDKGRLSHSQSAPSEEGQSSA